jgi:hypothetical protein
MNATQTADGLVIVMTRPSDFSREDEWAVWYDDVHLPETAEASGARVVSHWQVADRPSGFSPVQGFTHLDFYEFDDPAAGEQALLDAFDAERDGGRMHSCHCVVGTDAFASIGRWTKPTEHGPGLTGHVVSYVGTNAPAASDKWNEWLDNVHVPDMIATGAFVNARRWQRLQPVRYGANYLTVYDVETIDLSEAVQRSGAVMPGLHQSGRMFTEHYGGLRAMLSPAGRFGATGWAPPHA